MDDLIEVEMAEDGQLRGGVGEQLVGLMQGFQAHKVRVVPANVRDPLTTV